LIAFIAASLVLAIIPGPGVLYVVTRSLVDGRSSGLLSAVAMAVGNLACGLLVALGITTMVAAFPSLLTVLRYAGAAYLVYLGMRTIFTRPATTNAAASAASPRRVFLDGLAVALLNPKTILFFAAFLPQFMDAGAPAFLQASLLITVFVLIALVTDSSYALAAGLIAAPLQRSPHAQRLGRWVGGGFLVALGILAVISTA
jgi:threonine/homoserine/homoserine lactone efflux protein